MKRQAALVLSTLLVGGAFLLAPSAVADIGDGGGLQDPVPTVTVPDLTTSTTTTTTTIPQGDGGGDDDGSGDGDGGGDSPTTTTVPSSGDNTGGKAPKEDGEGGGTKTHPGGKKGSGKGKGGNKVDPSAYDGFQPSGTFSTTKLVEVATQLHSLGYTTEQVERIVYRPFIIAGDAAWSNTWGAPRYGPAPGQVRTHEGQDVFCNYGDPVIAAVDGTVEYDEGGLGGTVARLYAGPNSYWYYAHLSDINNEEFPNGAAVKAGDEIGNCGTSGNAATTPPHVHFGLYVNQQARNPHKQLVKWLHAAELRVLGAISKARNERIAQIDRLTLARRFGDSFAPDLAEMSVSGESLYASGSSPATGAFALAEAALQAALASTVDGPATTDPTTAAAAEAEEHAVEAEASPLDEWLNADSETTGTSATGNVGD
jgi:murein DD-endopeptidase MepM/ murein hydrolase activator NlpD